jgi:hypothetical protein
MVHLDDLVNAMTTTLSNIPELVADLAPVDPIVGYIDNNPVSNSVAKAIYQMQPGQVLVIWRSTTLAEGTMSKWDHRMEICVRALPGRSDLALIDEIMEGVPIPGDGLIWRICPIMDGLLPTLVTEITRETDTEGVDYGVILTSTLETGDWPNP